MFKRFFLIFVFLLLNACGYSSTLKNQQIDFSITSIEIQNKNKISFMVKNSLKSFERIKNKSKNYIIKIETDYSTRSTSKDSKGNPKTLELTVVVKLLVLEGTEKYQKDFIKTFAYTNRSNKFNLKNYEDSIVESLVEKISIEISQYLVKLSG